MRLLSDLRLRLRFFLEDVRGSMAAEAMIILPLLIWWYVASFQFFDAFREKNVNLKAAYTLADMISRETATLDKNYMEGLNLVFDYLTNSSDPTWIRVSSIEWDDEDKEFAIGWSYATKSKPKHTNSSIQNEAHQIPAMAVGDTAILVETFSNYKPIFNIGLEQQWYDTFIVTRPRFTSKINFSAGTS